MNIIDTVQVLEYSSVCCALEPIDEKVERAFVFVMGPAPRAHRRASAAQRTAARARALLGIK